MMHFSIPNTREFENESNGSSYTGYNIFINGSFHCCLRYRQMLSLHQQLKNSLPNLMLPQFPPKKLFLLTPKQLEQRRIQLERYIQLIGQDPVFSKSELLRTFLLNAQQESTFTEQQDVNLSIYLMNDYLVNVNCSSTECSGDVLKKLCRIIDLPNEYAHYFSLYLIRPEGNGTLTLVKKLMDFESPFISQKINNKCRIYIRKSYWDRQYDMHLMTDPVGLNLLYIQTVTDIEKEWVITTKDVRDQLCDLQERGNKREYLDVARSISSYGCLLFSDANIDYPEPNTVASVTVGNKELCIRNITDSNIQETKFKVTRMRCWRVTTNYNNVTDTTSNTSIENEPNPFRSIEVAFEYLMSKNILKWVTITSDQAVFISICLQSMVDELINQKDGHDLSNLQPLNSNTSQLVYIRRDNGHRQLTESSSVDTLSSMSDLDLNGGAMHKRRTLSEKSVVKNKIKEKISTSVFFRNGRDTVDNVAFEGIGDSDL